MKTIAPIYPILFSTALTGCSLSVREQQQECIELIANPVMQQIYPQEVLDGWLYKIRNCSTQFCVRTYKRQLEKMLTVAHKRVEKDKFD